MKKIFVIIFLLFTLNISAQSIKDFEGNWSGELKVFSGKTERVLTIMKLNIAPTDSAGVWTYQMIYSDKDIRDYKLRTVDAAKNKYAVDEGSNIIISESLVGNKLISSFEVEKSLLVVTQELQDDTLIFEIYSFLPLNKVKSGIGTKEAPFVYSYPLNGYQRAELKKK